MVLKELLVNVIDQEVGGSDNEDEEGEDELVDYSTDSNSYKCISGDDWRCYCKGGKSSINS